MKFKLKLGVLLFSLIALTSCGIKKDIQTADSVVKKEQQANQNDESNIEDENRALLQSATFNFNTSDYLKSQDKNDNTVTKESDELFDQYTFEYANKQVSEHITTYLNKNDPIAYSVDVFKKNKKGNGTIENKVLGFNLISNFLLESKLIDKPLDLIIDIKDIDKQDHQQFAITDQVSLVSTDQPEDDGLILQLLITE